MSLLLDKQYLNQISSQLLKFQRVNDSLWRFRCPFCGDSAHNPNKTRGYVFQKKGELRFFCQNCSTPGNIFKLLKQVNPGMANEYSLESFLEDKDTAKKTYTYAPQASSLPVAQDHQITLPTIADLPDSHPAKRYLINRKLPTKQLTGLYFTDDFASFVGKMATNYDIDRLAKNESRIIIPLYSEDGILNGFQGRSIPPSKSIRYITIKIFSNENKYFGLEKVKKDQKVYILEGSMDAMFLDNAIATLDSSLDRAKELKFKESVYVFDNEPRNKEIVAKYEKAVNLDLDVCIWNDDVRGKDINEMIVNGFAMEKIKSTIDARTYKGLRAQLELNHWRKV